MLKRDFEFAIVAQASVHLRPTRAQKALHIGWVPFIIGLALVSTEPRPNLLQMVTPM